MIPGVILFLILPLLMGGVVYALRRLTVLSGLLTSLTALILGVGIIVVPLGGSIQVWGWEIFVGDTVTFLGRELVMTPADRMAMAFLFLTAAGIFALAWRVAPNTLLFPIGLGLLSLSTAALLIRPLIYAALLIEVAAALSIFALQIEGQPPTQGGLRYLTFTMLALPGLMVTHWLMDRYALTPDDTSLILISGILLIISFALLLGSVPFHTWVPAVASDSEPLTGAFVLTVNNSVVWFLLLDFLEIYAELSTYPRFSYLISNLGMAMIIVGGLLAPGQRRLGRVMGYGALVDTGGALVALSLKSKLGVSLVFLSLLMRPFGLGLMAAGLSSLRRKWEVDDQVKSLRGLGWEAPVSTLALTLGGLSIAGLPISAGFVWRWVLYRSLAPASPGIVLLLLAATAGVVIGVWRGLSSLLAPPEPAEEENGAEESPKEETLSEGKLMVGIVMLGMIACVAVGLFPQYLAPLATRLAETYTFFAP